MTGRAEGAEGAGGAEGAEGAGGAEGAEGAGRAEGAEEAGGAEGAGLRGQREPAGLRGQREPAGLMGLMGQREPVGQRGQREPAGLREPRDPPSKLHLLKEYPVKKVPMHSTDNCMLTCALYSQVNSQKSYTINLNVSLNVLSIGIIIVTRLASHNTANDSRQHAAISQLASPTKDRLNICRNILTVWCPPLKIFPGRKILLRIGHRCDRTAECCVREGPAFLA